MPMERRHASRRESRANEAKNHWIEWDQYGMQRDSYPICRIAAFTYSSAVGMNKDDFSTNATCDAIFVDTYNGTWEQKTSYMKNI